MRRRNSPSSGQALIGEIETATTARRAAADRLAEAENVLAEADKAARAALEAVGEARAEAARAEERRDGAKRRLVDIEHEIREALDSRRRRRRNRRTQGRRDIAGHHRSRSQARPHSTRARAARRGQSAAPSRSCRRSRRNIANSLSERDDLIEAINQLRHGIHSLNHEARERLLASFATVNAHFEKLFTELFGGGTAELN